MVREAMSENTERATQDPPTVATSDFLLKHESGLDLGDRFENILQRQFDSLENLENKAWKTIGAITSIIGILVTGFSVLVKLSAQSNSVGFVDFIPLLVGLAALFISILYCVFVLVSTKAAYGPSTELSDRLSEGDIDREYVDFILKNYQNSIGKNWSRISTKSEYLRKSFCFLIVGLIFSTVSVLFVIFPPGEQALVVKIITIPSVLVISLGMVNHVWHRKFQTNNQESGDKEDEGEE